MTMSAARRRLIARAVQERPAWRLRFCYGSARLVGTVPKGYARDAAEAVAWYKANRPVCSGYDAVECDRG